MKVRRPFHLATWIANNRDLLKPPVANKNIYAESDDYIVMIVGGPNVRKDYHYNETEELFYQLEGDITVKIREHDTIEEIVIKEKELFLLPAGLLHQPIRAEGTVGLVIEQKKRKKDGLVWFCERCGFLLKEYKFVLQNIDKDFLPYFKEFYHSTSMRTCKKCGFIMEADARFFNPAG